MPKLSMDPNSKASQVLAIVREGPATTGEIALELGWHVRLVSAHLHNLRRKRKISAHPFRQPAFIRRGRPGQLWKIVER